MSCSCVIHKFVLIDEGESGMSELLFNACQKHAAQNCITSSDHVNSLYHVKEVSLLAVVAIR